MLYWKVKPEYDNFQILKTKDGCHYTLTRYIFENELLTETERIKFNIPTKCLEPKDINPHKTYFFFGARFEL